LRPRETDTPRLLKALQNLDREQQTAESRRLFYVAVTRAKERLILAGKETEAPGRPAAISWQKWFEGALGLTEEHKRKGVWEDPHKGFRVTIITAVNGIQAPAQVPAAGPAEALQVGPIEEPPQGCTIAATELGRMRQLWWKDPKEWRLNYRARLRTKVKLPDRSLVSGASDPDREAIGTAVGTVIHRLFEARDAFRRQNPEERRKLLEAMAARLLTPPPEADGQAEEASAAPAAPGHIRAVVNAVERVLQRLREAGTRGADLRRLLAAPGDPEVGFALDVGRWRVAGRFDKLLAAAGGWEIVDWKTDADDAVSALVARHQPQMKLYALALYRSGRAARPGGGVRVRLALLHHLRVETVSFAPAKLEAFEQELVGELEQMEAYEPE
jgi:ATP-dependent exoDNAse (exonuclease V) beta subunit